MFHTDLADEFKLTLPSFVSMLCKGVVCVTEQGRALDQCMGLGGSFGNDAHA